MRKADKAEIVQDIQGKFRRSKFRVLADFTGLPVEDMNRLRRQIQDMDGELKVVKNTLLERATGGASPLASHFVGPNAVTFGYGDPVNLAKVLVKFAQERPKFTLKAGMLADQALTAQEVEALSKLPEREVLLAQFLGVLQGVPGALVNVLAGVIRGLLNALVAIRDQKAEAEGAGAPPPAEAAAGPEAEAEPVPEAGPPEAE